MNFADLGLSKEVRDAVLDAGYTTATPIQEKAIPVVLMGRDILGCAQTGTGKTASFTLPMIDILANGRSRSRMPRTLILEPTRELAAQVAENFDTYGKYNKLSKALIIGGASMDKQNKLLEPLNIQDLGNLNLSSLEFPSSIGLTLEPGVYGLTAFVSNG